MNYQEILGKLQKKEFSPVYFFYGLESYFIDQLSDFIEKNVLQEAEKAFNQTVLYGKEVDHLAILDTARRFPMMAPYQVVILKEAQEMKTLKELQGYVEKPADTTILVICHKHKRFNTNTKFGKALKKQAVVFESKPLYDNQVPDWIMDYLKRNKLSIRPDVAALIGEYLGTNLSKVANELDKLAINLPKGSEVSKEHVEANIGISKDYNIFELQKALGQKDVLKANRIVQYFASNPKKNPLPVVIGSLFNYFSKLYQLSFLQQASEKDQLTKLKLRSPYFLKEYKAAKRHFNLAESEKVLHILKEYDLKSKGVEYNSVGKENGALLKEMVWKILH